MPKGDVPGEWYSPTQPFPTKPPAYDRQGVTEDDLIDFTPELRKRSARGRVLAQDGAAVHAARREQDRRPARHADGAEPGRRHELAGRLVRSRDRTSSTSRRGLRREQGPRRAVSRASRRWRTSKATPSPGRARRAARARPPAAVAASSRRRPSGRGDARDPSRGPPKLALSVQGLPLLKPPYGRISAIDMNRGEILWQIAHGETPDDIKNHPLLKGLDIPRTGQAGSPGHARDEDAADRRRAL